MGEYGDARCVFLDKFGCHRTSLNWLRVPCAGGQSYISTQTWSCSTLLSGRMRWTSWEKLNVTRFLRLLWRVAAAWAAFSSKTQIHGCHTWLTAAESPVLSRDWLSAMIPASRRTLRNTPPNAQPEHLVCSNVRHLLLHLCNAV